MRSLQDESIGQDSSLRNVTPSIVRKNVVADRLWRLGFILLGVFLLDYSFTYATIVGVLLLFLPQPWHRVKYFFVGCWLSVSLILLVEFANVLQAAVYSLQFFESEEWKKIAEEFIETISDAFRPQKAPVSFPTTQ